MTSASVSICQHCGYRQNDLSAVVCASCLRPLAAEPPAADSSFDPVSAAPYPPTPTAKPSAPTAPPAEREKPLVVPLLGGRATGAVTEVERVVGHPPIDPMRLLTACAIAVGGAPLLGLGQPSVGVVVAGVMLAIVAIGALLTLTARRSRNLLRITLIAAGHAPLHALMVDATGQPAIGNEVEVSGRLLVGGRFFARRLRVLSASTNQAEQSALARSGITYTGRTRVALWTPLLVLFFWAFFWLTLYLLLHYVLGYGIPH